MKKRTLALGLLLIAPLASLTIVYGEPAPPSKLMQRKLEYSQKALAGLATDDLEAVAKSATSLVTLTDEQWLRDDNPEYRAQLKAFRFSAQEMARLAKEKNLDGATLAYVQLTVSCVNCHKHLRSREM
jgi:hypothetical protein